MHVRLVLRTAIEGACLSPPARGLQQSTASPLPSKTSEMLSSSKRERWVFEGGITILKYIQITWRSIRVADPEMEK